MRLLLIIPDVIELFEKKLMNAMHGFSRNLSKLKNFRYYHLDSL